MLYKKLRVIHKLIIPPIIAFAFGILFVILIIFKIQIVQHEIETLETNLIPAVSKASKNNTQLKNIAEKFIFAVLASEVDMLPTTKEANTIRYNLQSMITNKILHLSTYNKSLSSFNQYFNLTSQQAHKLIKNSANISNSKDASRLIQLYNKVENDFFNIHKHLKTMIIKKTQHINNINNQIIYFIIFFILFFAFFLFVVSYFIYSDFSHKFKILRTKLYELDVISKKDRHINLDIDELSILSRRITNKIQEFKNLKKEKVQMERIANKDPLTMLYNRRYIPLIQKNIQEFNLSFAVIMLDIDFFKKVNDTYGHNTGDNVLVQFAHLLNNETRGDDTVIRYGGEEFLIILQNIPQDILLAKAEKIRRTIELTDFVVVGEITSSLGVAFAVNEHDIYKIIKYADIALYHAKNNGRNKVKLYSECA